MTPDRVATWIRPDGTVWKVGNTADRVAELLEHDRRLDEFEFDLASRRGEVGPQKTIRASFENHRRDGLRCTASRTLLMLDATFSSTPNARRSTRPGIDDARSAIDLGRSAILRTCVRPPPPLLTDRSGCSASIPASPAAGTRSSTAVGPGAVRAVSLGVIRTPPTDPLPQRLAALRREFTALIAEFAPDAVAVEQVFFQVNVRTAMSVGQASGLALAEAAIAGCEVVQYTPNQVKDAVAGWGGADKEQVQKMVQVTARTRPRCRSRPMPPTRRPCAVPSGDVADATPGRRGQRRLGMIGSLRGSVLERNVDGTVLIEVNGVGYLVTVSQRTLAELEPSTTHVPLRPPPHPRGHPDAVRVRRSRGTRHVPGAHRHARHRPGARDGDPGDASAARRSSTSSPTTTPRRCRSCPGVGKKTAERLIVELRDRLSIPVLERVGGGGGGQSSAVADVREALTGLGYGTDEVRDVLRDLSGDTDAVVAAARGTEVVGSAPCVTSSSIRASAPPTTCRATASRRRLEIEAGLRPRALDEFIGQRELKEHLHDRARGGAQAEPDRRPPPVRRAARARQDHAGRHRRHRDGRPSARHVRTGARAGRRSRGDPHQARRRRRAVHRRDPPAVAGGRGDPVPGDGGLPARHRRGQGPGGLEHPADDAAVHARRRDHPHRHDHGPAARPVRPRRPARLLRHRRTAGDRASAPPGSSASRSTPTARGRSPAGRGHAAHRQPAAAAGARLRRGPRRRDRSTPTSPATGWRCSASTTAGSTRSTGRSSPRCATQFNGGPVGLSTRGDQRRRAARDGRGHVRAVPHHPGHDRPHAAWPGRARRRVRAHRAAPPRGGPAAPACSTEHVRRGQSPADIRRRRSLGSVQIADFDYELPDDRIAQTPIEPRDGARLLVDRGSAAPEHRHVRDLPELLRDGRSAGAERDPGDPGPPAAAAGHGRNGGGPAARAVDPPTAAAGRRCCGPASGSASGRCSSPASARSCGWASARPPATRSTWNC